METVRYFNKDGGWRLAVVLSKGHKRITLLDIGAVSRVAIPVAHGRYLQSITINPRRLARTLGRQRRTIGKHHRVATKTSKAVERQLRTERTSQ